MKNNKFRKSLFLILGISATIWILLAVIAGALVTKTGSGEGCGPNWPLCHGKIIPDDPTLETVIEYSHRLVTGVAGILVFLFSISMIMIYRKYKEIVFIAGSALFFLLLQSALGALAVLDIGRASAILALHFGFSLLSYATVLLLTIYLIHLFKTENRSIANHSGQAGTKESVATYNQGADENQSSYRSLGFLPVGRISKRMQIGVFILFIYTYIVVYLGAYVRHTGSSLGCTDWPLCNGQLIPPLTGQMGIQFMHRVGALILFISFIILFYYVAKYYRKDKIFYYVSLSMLFLITLQVLTGGLVVLSSMNLYASMLHALIICLLFGLLLYILFYVFRRR